MSSDFGNIVLQYNEHYSIMISVRLWCRRSDINPWSSHIKDSKKWYMMPPCLTLSIIRYGSKG